MTEKKRDYYQVLGISKTANQSQIKKAYKKLAVKWHPDKNQNNRDEAVQKFREITQAYENLLDPQKRRIYDTYGFEGPKANVFSHYDFSQANDIFANFFSSNPFDHDDDDFFSSFFGRRKGNNGNKTGSGGFGMGGFSSMFGNDDFFKDAFGSGFGSGFSSSMSGGMGGMGGFSKSVSTTTKTVNGKTVTTKTTTVTKQDGSKQVTKQTTQNGKKKEEKYILGPGEADNKAKGKLKY